MQLLVAQQIIHQEKLKNNIMLYGYVDDNIHFLNIYDITIIQTFWSNRILMPQVGSWADISRKHLIRDCKKTVKNFNFILDVIKKCNIDTVFLGEIENHCYHLASMCFHRRGIKVCFYEEGSSHYVNNIGAALRSNFIDSLYGAFIDLFFYIPFFRVPYGKMSYLNGVNYSNIQMDVRYSIVPFYHEPFDKLLIYQPLLSDKLLQLLKSEVISSTDNDILLLTSPFYINGIDDNPLPYIKTIVDYAKLLDNTSILYIKFHPREKQAVRHEILSQFNREGINYKQLGNNYDIPIEYYLQFMQFKQIVMFLCSTYYYNGYLYPKAKFVSIMRDYYDNCKAVGSVNIKYIEPLLKEIPEG